MSVCPTVPAVPPVARPLRGTGGVDPRGLRAAAGLTSLVLALVLLTGSEILLAAQAVVFLVAAIGGLRRSPYGWLYRRLLVPRLGPARELEPAAPPRFAQAVGAGFTVLALAGSAAGVSLVTSVAVAAALVAALLNATVGLCLGCEMYLLVARLRHRSTRLSRSRSLAYTKETG